MGHNEALKDYLEMLKPLPVLSAQEELELAYRVSEGDEEAKRKMIESNLKLVVSVCKKMVRPNEDLLDVISSGNLGLYNAVDNYDYTKGFKFSTYATYWIRQKVLRDRANLSKTVRLPVHVQDTIRKMYREEENLYKELGYPPSIEEIAERMGTTAAKIEELYQYRMDVASLEMKVGDDENAILEEFIEAENTVSPEMSAIQCALKESVGKMLTEKLSEREAFVIKYRFGIDGHVPETLEDIGKKLGVSRERVRQIERGAMMKLRRAAKNLGMESFLVA